MNTLIKIRFVIVLVLILCLTNCKSKSSIAFKASPNDASVICMKASRTKKNNVLLSSFDGIYFSTDSTKNWECVSKQPIPSDPIEAIISHPHVENIWYAYSSKSIYLTNDNGKNWTLKINGLQKPNYTFKRKFKSLLQPINRTSKIQNTWDVLDICYPFYLKNTLYCATTNGIYVSTNNANSWQHMSKMLTSKEFTIVNDLPELNSIIAVDSSNYVFLFNYKTETLIDKGTFSNGTIIDVVTIKENKLLFLTTEGLFERTVFFDASRKDTICPILLRKDITDCFFENDYLVAVSGNKISYSVDFGLNWIQSYVPAGNNIVSIEYGSKNQNYYALSKMHGVFYSKDLFIWECRQKEIYECTVNGIYSDVSPKTKLYAITDGSGVFCSFDHGKVWKPTNTGVEYLDIKEMIITTHDSHRIYAGTKNHGLYFSLNKGQNWMPQNKLMNSLTIDALSYDIDDPRHIIVGTWNRKYEQSELYYTINDGWEWYPIIFPSRITSIISMKGKREQHWIGTRHGLYGWDTEKLIFYFTDFTKTITCMKQDPFSQDTVYIGTMSGLFVSYDNCYTISSILNEYENKIGSVSDIIFDPINKGTIYFSTGNQFYMSDSDGIKWSKQTSKNNDFLFSCLFADVIDPGIIYAGTKNNGIVYSNNKGKNWHISDNKVNK
ncbi:MAG: hypothetical protein KAH01_08195 [Caldisericia bacterium]|nr:hypothetical protein [Caldisericia bacterium]